MNFDIDNITGQHWIIVLVGYVVVFVSLTLLAFIFQKVPDLLSIELKSLFNRKVVKAVSSIDDTASIGTRKITGEQTAAISMAVFLFVGQLHDDENTVLTIQKISKRYSPWSSKIYSVTNGLNKRF